MDKRKKDEEEAKRARCQEIMRQLRDVCIAGECYELTTSNAVYLLQAYCREGVIYFRSLDVHRYGLPNDLELMVSVERVHVNGLLPLADFGDDRCPGWTDGHAVAFENRFQVSLPRQRRPTLEEYENRRGQCVDRYSFGTYEY